MRTQKCKTNRGTTPKETYMETANEDLVKAFSLRKLSAKYSVNFMTLQRVCKRFEVGNENKFYIEQFYKSF
jgi:hypothetical protein